MDKLCRHPDILQGACIWMQCAYIYHILVGSLLVENVLQLCLSKVAVWFVTEVQRTLKFSARAVMVKCGER
jgi:hypothetical protein